MVSIFFSLLSRPPPRSTLFPYTTLFRSRQRRAHQPDERVRRDVVRHAEPLARGRDEVALEVLALRERHGVDERVEAPEVARHAGEDGGDLAVRPDVTGVAHRAGQRPGQLLDVLLETVTLVGERKTHPGARERPGDGPGDGALVGDPEDDAGRAVEQTHARDPRGS